MVLKKSKKGFIITKAQKFAYYKNHLKILDNSPHFFFCLASRLKLKRVP